MSTSIPHDSAIARLAARQQGNVTRVQLLELGLGPGAIDHRVRSGRLFVVYPGVYSVGRPPRTALERAAAAVLACGEGAALSHTSALALWGLRDRWPSQLEVTVVADHRRAGIKVHRSSTLTRRDLRKHQGIRATSPARTLLDCAPRLTDAALARAVNDALRSPHLSKAQLAEIIQRCHRHPGAKLLAPFLDRPGAPTRSELEDAFVSFCARYGLPTPLTNTILAGYEVDAYFPAHALIVELDGYGYHSGRTTFEADRDRDADTLLAGLATVRMTYRRLTERADDEAARLTAILDARARS